MKAVLPKLLFAVTLLAGCTVGPNYKPPATTVAKAYHELPANAATNQPSQITAEGESLRHWWTVFHDPNLDSLIDRALKGNRDLLIALSRVREARAQREVVASGLLPEMDATAGYDHALGSKNVKIPLSALEGSSGSTTGTVPGATIQRVGKSQEASAAPLGGPQSPFGLGGLPGATTDLYQVGLDTSWQIDVFGGTRRAIEAARANIAAVEENRRAVLVSLLADVATNYLDLRLKQQRLEIARENLAIQKEILALAQARFTNGLGTELDVAQQSAQVSSTSAVLAPLESSEHDDVHVLSFLLGQEPMAVWPELAALHPLPQVPPQVPVGIPSDILRRRPDIRRAERQLASATAQVGVATADLFPKFSLTGVVGMDSSQPGNLLDWNSRYFAISPGVSWPILDWGRIRGNIRVQNELQSQSLTAYEQTVLNALRQVEDALVHYQKEQSRRKDLSDAVSASQRALELARQSYEKGVTDITTVLDAERSLYGSQDALMQSDGAIRVDLVRLYVALGGGWEPSEEPAENFDHIAPGTLPAGWTAGITGPGAFHWAVVADSSAPSAPNVLEQSGRAASHGYPWCVNTNINLRDGFVETKFKPISGQEDQAGGVIWRWQNSDNYYIARGNALETNLILFRMSGGKRSKIRIAPFPITANQWHTLRVDFQATRITIQCDSRNVIDCTDATIQNPGAAGVWTKADSITRFDDFRCGK